MCIHKCVLRSVLKHFTGLSDFCDSFNNVEDNEEICTNEICNNKAHFSLSNIENNPNSWFIGIVNSYLFIFIYSFVLQFNVQRLQDAHALSQPSSSGVGLSGNEHGIYLQGSAHSSGGSVSSAGGASPNSPLRPGKEEDCSLHGRSSTEGACLVNQTLKVHIKILHRQFCLFISML